MLSLFLFSKHLSILILSLSSRVPTTVTKTRTMMMKRKARRKKSPTTTTIRNSPMRTLSATATTMTARRKMRKMIDSCSRPRAEPAVMKRSRIERDCY